MAGKESKYKIEDVLNFLKKKNVKVSITEKERSVVVPQGVSVGLGTLGRIDFLTNHNGFSYVNKNW